MKKEGHGQPSMPCTSLTPVLEPSSADSGSCCGQHSRRSAPLPLLFFVWTQVRLQDQVHQEDVGHVVKLLPRAGHQGRGDFSGFTFFAC